MLSEIGTLTRVRDGFVECCTLRDSFHFGAETVNIPNPITPLCDFIQVGAERFTLVCVLFRVCPYRLESSIFDISLSGAIAPGQAIPRPPMALGRDRASSTHVN